MSLFLLYLPFRFYPTVDNCKQKQLPRTINRGLFTRLSPRNLTFLEENMKTNYCGVYLDNELKVRKQRNGLFSLRSFSRFLGLSPTALSQCINDKRNLSRTNIEKVCKALDICEEAKKFFLEDVKRKHQFFKLYLI